MSLTENTESRNKFMEIIVSIEKNNKDDKMLKSLVNKSKEYLSRRMLSPKFEELKINKDKLLYFNRVLKKNKTIKHFKNFISSLSDNKSDKWKVLKQKAGENETISKKKLYIEQLEKQELDDRLKQFKISRNEKINKLQNINEEKSFKIIPFISKIKQKILII